MPCYEPPMENTELENRLNKVEAMLCAVLMASDPATLFNKIDYETSGITQYEIVNWFHNHLLKDITKIMKT